MVYYSLTSPTLLMSILPSVSYIVVMIIAIPHITSDESSMKSFPTLMSVSCLIIH